MKCECAFTQQPALTEVKTSENGGRARPEQVFCVTGWQCGPTDEADACLLYTSDAADE